ncbi:histone-fold-containing protein [Sporormia fimetaria CBS 119925]|uniref:DNA polymerase epsilon subunit D n=1 Tax=Sporormia fimetaria CBS 119925 TaxID=1340428 RepID=A0A6A6V9J6_9PLEO|nr:histone-fold-containing protein [Sporormia fimetaria CBS 119925]
MPTRKSTASAASPENSSKSASKEDGLGVEDLNLPKSIVQRLAKGVLPANTQIQKDALLAMSKSATVFVNYLSSQAAETAARRNKKTVVPEDVFEAMRELEFEAMLPRLQAEVEKFASTQASKRNEYRKKVKEDKKGKQETGAEESSTANGHGAADDSPPAKRLRRSGGDRPELREGSGDDGEADEPEEDVEDDEEDEEVEEDEVDDEPQEEGLTEDPIEVRDSEVSEDDMADGDESD